MKKMNIQKLAVGFGIFFGYYLVSTVLAKKLPASIKDTIDGL